MNKEIYYNLLNKGLYALTYESNQNKKAVLLENGQKLLVLPAKICYAVSKNIVGEFA